MILPWKTAVFVSKVMLYLESFQQGQKKRVVIKTSVKRRKPAFQTRRITDLLASRFKEQPHKGIIEQILKELHINRDGMYVHEVVRDVGGGLTRSKCMDYMNALVRTEAVTRVNKKDFAFVQMDPQRDAYPEWTGTMSYAGDVMSSSSLNALGNANIRATSGAPAAASTRTLPHYGMSANRSAESQYIEYNAGGPLGSHFQSASTSHVGMQTPKVPSEGTAFNSDHDDLLIEKHAHETIEDLETTQTRRIWTFITWSLTWWIPSPFLRWCGRMKRPDVRMAWREKVAICIIIVFIWLVLLFVIIGLGLVLCPKEHVWTLDEVAGHNSEKDAYIAMRGKVYDITGYMKQKHGIPSFVASKELMVMFAGQDVNASFPIAIRTACPTIVSQKQDPRYSMYLTVADTTALQTFPFTHKVGALSSSKELSSQSFYAKYAVPTLNLFKKGDVVWSYGWVDSMHKDQGKYWRVINQEVFNLEDYFATIEAPGNTGKEWRFLDSHIENIFDDKGAGSTDITNEWSRIQWSPQERQANYDCMKNLFYVGKVDDRHSVRCLFTNYMLLAFACVLMALVLIKFIAALQFGTKN
ncbi:hypothetical protein GGI12_005412, partial [Dipsacomyces acuminosporus]